MAKIGSARNQHPYIICLVSAKPGKIWPSKNPKRFFPSFFLQNFVNHMLILIYNLFTIIFSSSNMQEHMCDINSFDLVRSSALFGHVVGSSAITVGVSVYTLDC